MPENAKLQPAFFDRSHAYPSVAKAERSIDAILDQALLVNGFAADDEGARLVALTAIRAVAAQAIASRQARYESAYNATVLSAARKGEVCADPYDRASNEANGSLYWDICGVGETVEKAEAEFAKRMDEDRVAILRHDEALAERAANDDAPPAEAAA